MNNICIIITQIQNLCNGLKKKNVVKLAISAYYVVIQQNKA